MFQSQWNLLSFEKSLLSLQEGKGIHSRENILWCSFEGKPSSSAIQKPLSFISEVTSGITKASVEDVSFRDPDYFITGEVHNHYHIWSKSYMVFTRRRRFLSISQKACRFLIFSNHLKEILKGEVLIPSCHPKCSSRIIKSVMNMKILSPPQF